MIRIQNKIAQGMEVLTFFTMRRWEFNEDNFRGIQNYLNDQDKKT